MATLLEDIKTHSEWILRSFAVDGLTLDYTVRSFIEIDRFFHLHSKNGEAIPDGRLSESYGAIIFSIGSYVGETMIKTIPGAEWITDDNDPEGELNASIKLPDGMIVWPMMRVLKRFKEGAEESVYVYGHHFVEHLPNQKFDGAYWEMEKVFAKKHTPWWKFW